MSALALTACAACAAAPTVDEHVLGPEPPTRCTTSPEAFDAAMLDYATEHDLPLAWVAFEASEYPRLCLAHDVAAWHREHGGVRLSVSSCRDVPDTEGEERAAALGRLLALAYPRLPFELAWHGDGLPLVLDCTSALGTLHGARVIRDGGAVHEIGHLLGLRHHYMSPEQAGAGLHMWSSDESCTMDLTGGLDSACAGALGVELPDEGALAAATWELYCAGCERGDFVAAACGGCL